MHLSFALQAGNALAKRPLVGANGVLQRLITVENRSETERKNRPLAETYANHPRMLQDVFLFQRRGRPLKFADDHGKITTRIAEYRGPVHPLNPIQNEGTAGASSICDLVLSEAVRVPGHKRSLQAGQRRTCIPRFFDNALVEPRKKGQLNTARSDAKSRIQPHLTPGESKNATISWHP